MDKTKAVNDGHTVLDIYVYYAHDISIKMALCGNGVFTSCSLKFWDNLQEYKGYCLPRDYLSVVMVNCHCVEAYRLNSNVVTI